MSGFSVVPMTLAHLDQVLEVERLSFSSPWSRFAFQTELKQNQYALYLVGKYQERVVAYAGTWIVLGEAHITNIAIHPAWRGRGFGHQLLRGLLAAAKERGANRATLEVRTGNKVAQALYLKHGFKFCGLRRGYYTDTGEDALIMWKDDLSDSQLPLPLEPAKPTDTEGVVD
ncbi:MAG: ribosomal protein S18-alanine N-acetyltransferase [Bacillota bacterium]